jgi:putative endonuclease
VSRAKGSAAEERACRYLRNEGFDLVDRNVHSRFGEIDIIAVKNGVLHFVEVKSGEAYESAVQNITPEKIRRILKTADSYMARHRLDLDYTLDAVIVVGEQTHFLADITL